MSNLIQRKTYGSEPEQKYVFQPKENISVYELAQLLPILSASWHSSSDVYEISKGLIPSSMKAKIDGLPENLRRHFSFTDK
jgi:hypothetical protein